MRVIYKIVAAADWATATAAGVFHGAAIDVADGYIHLSDASQAEETARRHFAGQAGLVLVAFAAALWVKPLPWRDGAHEFPVGWNG
jgi:uncharacterized protein (DUF952 family)